MAYDSYRESPSSYGPPTSQDGFAEPRSPPSASYIPPYLSQYASDQIQMPQPRIPSSHLHPPPSSSPNTQGHVNYAASAAANKAENLGILTPEVISHITAAVIQQLKAYGLGNLQGQQQQQTAQAPSYTKSSASGAGRSIYTPPSSESHGFDSPQLQNRTAQTSHTSPRPAAAPTPERREPMSNQYSDHDQKEFRPKAPTRVPTWGEMTTLERIWGKLFEDGKPTEKLGQFLRGIAVYLVGAGH